MKYFYISVWALCVASCATAPQTNPWTTQKSRDINRKAGNPVLVYRVETQYPRQAAIDKIQGCVSVNYIIGLDGHPHSIVIVDSQPKGIFDRVAIDSLMQWYWEPLTIEQQVSQIIEYELLDPMAKVKLICKKA